MYSLTDLCSLCLVNSTTIISILSEDADGIVVKNKLKYALSEVLNYKPEILKNICVDCLKGLNYVYKFKQKCLQNVMSLNDFIEQMTVENEESNYFVATELQNQATGHHFLANETQNTPQDETMDTNLLCGTLTQQNMQNIVKREPEDDKDTEMQYNSSVFAETTENPPEINTASNAESLSTNSVYIKHSNMFENQIPDSNKCGNEKFNVKNEYIHDEVDIKNDPLLSDEPDEEDSADISNEASNSSAPGLPFKSKERYQNAYQQFDNWCLDNNVQIVNEDVLLAYFEEKSQVLKSPSLWSLFSMLRTTLSLNKNIDIKRFAKLVDFIKRKAKGHQSKITSTLTKLDIETFLKEADDRTYLLMKVALIIGISGGCTRDELTYLQLDNIKDMGPYILIELPQNSKTNERREVTITRGHISGLDLVGIFRKYAALRPSRIDSNRFFLCYRNGKCTRQSVGLHSIGGIPRKIAEYLKLPEPSNYTGHCFRRSSAAVLAAAGADIVTVKRLGGWK